MRSLITICWALACSCAPAATIVEQWGGDGRFAHPKALGIDQGGRTITINLSALPAGAKVHSARLVCFRTEPPADSDEALTAVAILAAGRPLKLLPPWYDAFAVPPGLLRPGGKLALEVKAFPGWVRDKTYLEIAYEGTPKRDLPVAASAEAVHAHGQTFVTWQEIEKVVEADRPTWGDLKARLEDLDAKRRVRYRVYAAGKPITPENLPAATLLAEVKPLSGCNIHGRSPDQAFSIMRKLMLEDLDYAKAVSRNHYAIPPSAYDEVAIDRFVIPGRREPLPNGTGLYVHHPPEAGRGHYAVTVVLDGRENTARFATAGPVEEKPGRGKPVFQREMDMEVLFDYAGRRLQYVQWAGGPQTPRKASGALAPPLSNLPNRYYNWSVFVPQGVKLPAPLEIVLTGSGMFRRPRWPHRLDTILVSPHDAPLPTLYYGYPEARGTLRGLREGTIQPYTWRRMLAFLEWAFEDLKLTRSQIGPSVDRSRVTCTGDRGLSATAALHFGMRHPEVFSVVYTCKGMPNPAALPLVRQRYGRRIPTGTHAMQKVFGRIEWGLKTPDGRSVWEVFHLTKEIAARPEVLRPLLSYGGRGGWDFKPVAEMLAALAAARQPVVSEGTWGAVGPPFVKNPGRGWSGLDVRRDRPIPVFTNHSSDYQGGRNGDGGQTNYGAWWDDASIVDAPDRFEIVLTGGGTVSVTPRRTSKFVLQPGAKVAYRFQPSKRPHGRTPEPVEGQTVADRLGLVTIPKLPLPGKLTLTRSGS